MGPNLYFSPVSQKNVILEVNRPLDMGRPYVQTPTWRLSAADAKKRCLASWIWSNMLVVTWPVEKMNIIRHEDPNQCVQLWFASLDCHNVPDQTASFSVPITLSILAGKVEESIMRNRSSIPSCFHFSIFFWGLPYVAILYNLYHWYPIAIPQYPRVIHCPL